LRSTGAGHYRKPRNSYSRTRDIPRGISADSRQAIPNRDGDSSSQRRQPAAFPPTARPSALFSLPPSLLSPSFQPSTCKRGIIFGTCQPTLLERCPLRPLRHTERYFRYLASTAGLKVFSAPWHVEVARARSSLPCRSFCSRCLSFSARPNLFLVNTNNFEPPAQTSSSPANFPHIRRAVLTRSERWLLRPWTTSPRRVIDSTVGNPLPLSTSAPRVLLSLFPGQHPRRNAPADLAQTMPPATTATSEAPRRDATTATTALAVGLPRLWAGTGTSDFSHPRLERTCYSKS